jgi:hypothetical protein
LQPIIDFSVPPDLAYHRIPAWELLDSHFRTEKLPAIDRQVVVLAAEFSDAGISTEGADNFSLPPAVKYWRTRENPPNWHEKLTGGEAHAYMIHHLLRNRLVVPIPDLWGVGVAILLGKGVVLGLRQSAWRTRAIARSIVALIPLVYGAVSVQAYVSAAILLPWLLPAAAFWIYGIPILLRRKKQ